MRAHAPGPPSTTMLGSKIHHIYITRNTMTSQRRIRTPLHLRPSVSSTRWLWRSVSSAQWREWRGEMRRAALWRGAHYICCQRNDQSVANVDETIAVDVAGPSIAILAIPVPVNGGSVDVGVGIMKLGL